MLVQLGWKGGFYTLDRQIVVNSIERMDGFYPHGKDFQFIRPIRSQTLYPLSYGCGINSIIPQRIY
jgi:hypothetical protein